MSGCPVTRLLITAILMATALLIAGCGEDCETCPSCPDTGYRTIIIRSDGTGDEPTIQDAIDQSLRGDIIVLEDGAYRGPKNRNLTVGGKSLVLISRSGNPAACYIDCGDSGMQESRALLVVDNREGLRIDGIGFRNARSSIGGGIYCLRSSLHMINCVFVENEAESGGGLAALDSDVLLEECLFEDNSADVGGGLWAESGEVRIYASHFRNNEGALMGGGVGSHGTHLTISNCSFSGNSAFGSGGGIASSYGSLRASDLRCSGNAAGQYGGMLFIEDAQTAVMTDSEVTDNRARSGSAVYASCNLILSGCTIARNLAGDQGAIRHVGGVLLTMSCTIADNAGPDYGAALVLSSDSPAVLQKCIIAYNQTGFAVLCFGDALVQLSCCDVYGHSHGDYEECLIGQLGERGNISADPRFCGITDYGLLDGSPCAEATCGLMGSRGTGCR